MKTFAGRAWPDLDVDTVESHYFALSFFAPEAFRYYLPAYMVGCINSPATTLQIKHSVVFHLAPPDSELNRPWFMEIVRGFTSPQKSAIRQFLEYMEAARDDRSKTMKRALKTFGAS